MRNIITLVCSLLLAAGCTKEKLNNQKPASFINSARTLSEIEMSDLGYLIFSDSTDMFEYTQDLLSKTYSEVESEYDQIGFTSNHIFDPTLNDSTISAGDIHDLILNSHSVVQIGNLILRPLDETKQLVMSASLIDSTSYSCLCASIYDETYMCRLSTSNPNFDDLGELESLIATTPAGVDDTTNYVPKRKFFGKTVHHDFVPSGNPSNPILYCYKIVTFWVFWSQVWQSDVIIEPCP